MTNTEYQSTKRKNKFLERLYDRSYREDPFKTLFFLFLFSIQVTEAHYLWTAFPEVAFEPLFLHFESLRNLPLSLWRGIEMLWLALLLISCTNFSPRLISFLTAFIGTSLLGWSQAYGLVYNNTALVCLFLWLIFFTEMLKRPALEKKQIRHSLALVLFSLALFSAGYQKLINSGLVWLSGENASLMLKRILITYGRELEIQWQLGLSQAIVQSPFFSQLVAGGIFLVELLAPIGVFFLWGRRTITLTLMAMIALVYPFWGINFYKMMPAFFLVLPTLTYPNPMIRKALLAPTGLICLPAIFVTFLSTDYFWPYSMYKMYSRKAQSCHSVLYLYPDHQTEPGNRFYYPLEDKMQLSYLVLRHLALRDGLEREAWLPIFMQQYKEFFTLVNGDSRDFSLILKSYDLTKEDFQRPLSRQVLAQTRNGFIATPIELFKGGEACPR